MRKIWDTLLYWDEAEMLRMHLEEVGPHVHKVILVEARYTFGGDPKPLCYDPADFPEWADKIVSVVADTPETDNPWVREFAQRDAAWGALCDQDDISLDDVVIIGDVDEIPSRAALAWNGWPVCTLQMQTALYAVDWLIPGWYRQPPMTVMATVRWIKSRGGRLAELRQNRGGYPVLQDGGWHFSWLGGPEKQFLKLETGTSHTEIMDTPEAALIRSGARWRDGASGPGIPVEPATVDDSWPAFIRERRCPPEWFRPADGHWVRPAADDPAEIRDYLWAGYPEGKLAFEVGANHGQSIPKMTGRYERVIGFEPYPANHRIASMIPGADVRMAAVSSTDGFVTLTVVNDQLVSPAHESWERLHLAAEEVITVPCVTLDTVMADEGVPDFVNMDVEGHELDVLHGAPQLIATKRPRWLIEFHSHDQKDGCAKLLDDAGYDVEIVRHPHYAPGSAYWDEHGWLKAAPGRS
jgi:FkbM family methyltransferase